MKKKNVMSGFARRFIHDTSKWTKRQKHKLWNVGSGKSLRLFEGYSAWLSASIYDIAFSPDGKRLASASGDHTVITWDVSSGEMLQTLEPHLDPVYGIALLP